MTLCDIIGARTAAHRGQAATEYVLVLAALSLVAVALFGFVRLVQRHADRAESLVMSDCP